MRAEIHNKLITDFEALEFENTNNKIFSSVKKFYKGDFGAGDCLLVTDGLNEDISGNTSTYRSYGFLVVWLEELEQASSDAQTNNKVDRMNNAEDIVLNYIQKEPSNLNSWGQAQTPVIDIFKIRLLNAVEDDVQTTNGYGKIKRVRFSVHVNIVPQLL